MQGRRPEKLLLAWKILIDEVKKSPLPGNNRTVYEPLKLLTVRGPMSYGTAGQCLTKFEKARRLTKHTNGTTRLLFVEMLTLEDLGEDVLGEHEERPSLHTNPPRPSTDELPSGATDARKDASSELVVLCDFQNLYRTLEDTGVALNFNDLIKLARQYGEVAQSIAFLPPHIHEDVQTKLRVSGFRIESCPPRKLMGPDTCDQAIEEFVRFCINYTNIGTFVIVSGDGDFVDIADIIGNHTRKRILFHCGYNDTSRELLSRFDEVIDISNLTRPKETVRDSARKVTSPKKENGEIGGHQPAAKSNSVGQGVDKYSYNKILENLRNGTAAPDRTNVCWSFLKAVVSCLKDSGLASEDLDCRNSFSELKEMVWREISSEFAGVPTVYDDCRSALYALRDFSIIKARAQQKNPKTYYVFDPNHPLLAAILKQ